MRSSNIGYLPQVDHLRAVAAVWIVLYHGMQLLGSRLVDGRAFGFDRWPRTGNPLFAVALEGHTAVALFMVLSGFIFAHGALGRSVDYGRFIGNRLLRIYPLYVSVVLLAVTIRSADGGAVVNLSSLTILLLPLADFRWQNTDVFVPMSWAIAVEFQFYLIFPFLIGPFSRRPVRVALGVIGVALAYRVLGVANGANARDIGYWHLAGRIDQFLCGMLAAVAYRRAEGRRWLPPLVLVASGVAAVVALYEFNRHGGLPSLHRWKIFWPTVEGAIWAGVVFGYVRGRDRWPRPLSSALAAVGETSFSIYLLHAWVISAIEPRAGRLLKLTHRPFVDGLIDAALIVLPITLALSFLTFHVIERPFLERRRRYLTAPETPPAAAAMSGGEPAVTPPAEPPESPPAGPASP